MRRKLKHSIKHLCYKKAFIEGSEKQQTTSLLQNLSVHSLPLNLCPVLRVIQNHGVIESVNRIALP